MSLVAFIGLGLLVGFGLVIIAVGISGSFQLPSLGAAADGKFRFDYPMAKVAAYPALSFIVVFAITRWIIAAVAIAIVAAILPRAAARQREEQAYILRTEALAAWIALLRDSVVAGGGLEEPLRRSAHSGPEMLRPDLTILSADLSTMSTTDALKRFAARMEHHVCDLLVASYAIAIRESTTGLLDLFTELANNASQEVTTFRNVDKSRKQLRNSVRITLVVTFMFIALPFIFARPLLAPYDTAMGQFVLAIVAGMIMGSWLWMQKMQRLRRPPRFFALDVTDTR